MCFVDERKHSCQDVTLFVFHNPPVSTAKHGTVVHISHDFTLGRCSEWSSFLVFVYEQVLVTHEVGVREEGVHALQEIVRHNRYISFGVAEKDCVFNWLHS